MEKLLNDLLRMWWKPFNGDKTLHIDCYDKCKWLNYKWIHLDGWFMNEENRTLRELVSIDSGLWQFVCDREHRFIDERNYDGVSLDKRLKNPYVDYDGVNTEYEWITSLDYQYWVIEASLKDERELEQFLLDNIKIDEKKS